MRKLDEYIVNLYRILYMVLTIELFRVFFSSRRTPNYLLPYHTRQRLLHTSTPDETDIPLVKARRILSLSNICLKTSLRGIGRPDRMGKTRLARLS